jgi:hypothetical protein
VWCDVDAIVSVVAQQYRNLTGSNLPCARRSAAEAQILGAVSRRPPVRLSRLPSADADAGTLECWGRAYAGTGPFSPLTAPAPQQRESLGLFYGLVRDLSRARYGLQPLHSAARLLPLCSERALKVLVSLKVDGRRVANVEDLAGWTRAHHLGVGSEEGQTGRVGFDVELLAWENPRAGFRAQLAALAVADVYVAVARGEVASAVFLPDGAALLAAPECDVSGVCEFSEGGLLLDHLPHVGSFVYVVAEDEVLETGGGGGGHMRVRYKQEKYAELLDRAGWFVLLKLSPGGARYDTCPQSPALLSDIPLEATGQWPSLTQGELPAPNTAGGRI